MVIESPRLNRHGRPWGVPREHVNKSGAPKPARTREASIAKAIELMIDRAIKHRERRLGGGQLLRSGRPISMEAYECSVCGWWYEGSTPRYRRNRSILMTELGDRAFWNLQAENKGNQAKREFAIGRRFKRRTCTLK